MSKGSPIVSARISEKDNDSLLAYLERVKGKSFACEKSVGDFVREALREKLAHLERGRNRQARRRKQADMNTCVACKDRPRLANSVICVACREDYINGINPTKKPESLRGGLPRG